MKARLLALPLALVACAVAPAFLVVGACSSNETPSSPASDDAGGEAGDASGPTFTPEVSCADSVDSIYADPGDVSAQAKGAILKCAHDKDLSMADLEAAARASQNVDGGIAGYSGKKFASGARVYRVLYRTERGDAKGTPGYSSALVFLPDTPRAASTLPIVVYAHGSRGQAAKCAPSKNDPAASNVEPDFVHGVYPLVGLGFPVIAPDFAGYANYGGAGNAPSAYASTGDGGKSVLDGARAMRKLVPSSVSTQVVLVGHSQGGHPALSALSLADSYGADGTIAAVAVYAPLWWSQRTWAALFLASDQYPFGASSAGKVSIWYHYTHGELLDGPGHGVDVFAASKRDAVKAFVDDDCWAAPDLFALGGDAGAEAGVAQVFDPAYQSALGGGTAALSDNCNGDATCQKWLDRMTADWPHLSGGAAKVPILVWYSANDTTITPDAMKCVFDRLTGDGANVTVCYHKDPLSLGHNDIVSAEADYVADWLSAQTLSTQPPAACPYDQKAMVDDAGAAIQCNPLVPKK